MPFNFVVVATPSQSDQRKPNRQKIFVILITAFSLIVMVLTSSKAQTPGTWSGPIYSVIGTETTGYITTNDGQTYVQNEQSTDISTQSNTWGCSPVGGGYYQGYGANFYYGELKVDIFVVVQYKYYLNKGEFYNPSTKYLVPVTCNFTGTVKVGQPDGTAGAPTADNGLGSGPISYQLWPGSSYINTSSNGSMNEPSLRTDYSSSENTVVVTTEFHASGSAVNTNQTSWASNYSVTVSSTTPQPQ